MQNKKKKEKENNNTKTKKHYNKKCLDKKRKLSVKTWLK